MTLSLEEQLLLQQYQLDILDGRTPTADQFRELMRAIREGRDNAARAVASANRTRRAAERPPFTVDMFFSTSTGDQTDGSVPDGTGQ